MEITKKISYAPLWKTLIDQNIKNKTDLLELAGIGSGTLAKLSKNQEVSMNVILRICQALQCELADVIELTD
jgi:DNA-binding Xre family transcriptional regulator